MKALKYIIWVLFSLSLLCMLVFVAGYIAAVSGKLAYSWNTYFFHEVTALILLLQLLTVLAFILYAVLRKKKAVYFLWVGLVIFFLTFDVFCDNVHGIFGQV